MLKVGIEKMERSLPQVDIEKRPNIWSLYFYTVGEIMKLYYVDEDYINELRNVDERVLLNKSTRPYLGVVLSINDLNYFVPLSSPKENKKLNNQLSIKLFEVNNIQNRLGYLLFLNMIPVPDKYLSKIDMQYIKEQDLEYYNLLTNQLIFIRQENQRIVNKAQKVYKNAVIKKVSFLNQCCVDYLALERYVKDLKQ
jgi:protein AbiQ